MCVGGGRNNTLLQRAHSLKPAFRRTGQSSKKDLTEQNDGTKISSEDAVLESDCEANSSLCSSLRFTCGDRSISMSVQETLTKLLQSRRLHLCRKIFCLQQTFIRFFRRSVFLLQAERGEDENEERGKKKRDGEVVKTRQEVSEFYGSIWTDTKSLKTSTHS